MAEVLLRHLVAEDPSLSERVSVASAGTARWHVGEPMDPRARRALDRAGFHLPGSLGTYADSDFLERQDLILVMTREHRADVHQRLRRRTPEVVLWRDLFESTPGLDLADPYYGDDQEFDQCLATLGSAEPALLSLLHQRLEDARFSKTMLDAE
jgi:low molecular weight protein-tyrosine phosphatase